MRLIQSFQEYLLDELLPKTYLFDTETQIDFEGGGIRT